ncbi:MAG TPA: Ig-like domain-containing protein, partial [Ilumatobacteraceae bacterium]|nr:Ig-like domain-containing protein [Ilumatobacteraceae bacterium]
VINPGTCPSTGIRVPAILLLGQTCAAFGGTTFNFTTEVANPVATVIATNPAANATNVTKRAPVITATFSEDVQGVTSTTATIARTGGGVIAATVSYNSTTHVVTITPAANLRANTSFTVTLRGGATAIREATSPFRPLVTKTWSFTTGA